MWREIADMAMPLRDLAPATSPPRTVLSSTLSTRRRQKSYQACEHCRRRKAKCELEEVHGIIASSCVRCRRERKKCIFSAERSAKLSKNLLAENGGLDESPDRDPHGGDRQTFSERSGPSNMSPNCPPTPLSNTSRSEVALKVDAAEKGPGGALPSENREQQNIEDHPNTVLRSVMRNQNDALNLLFDAATYETSSGIQSHHAGSRHSSGQVADNAQTSYNMSMSPLISMDPCHTWCMLRHPLSHPSQGVQAAWQSCPFVKNKWMTAQEAVTYVDLFFRNVVPMSPILDDYYADHAHHQDLTIRDPILCCTILTLSTRYHLLTGVSSLSRGFILHERLWESCQSLLQDVIWGNGLHMQQNQLVIGAIESLLLLTEWNPRSFPSRHHFGKDSGMGWPIDEEAPENLISKGDWYERVVEPSRKGDRIAWMHLGTAVALAHEIDLYNQFNGSHVMSSSGASKPEVEAHLLRRCDRLKRLLFMYTNQLALRIGGADSKYPFNFAMRETIHGPPISAEAKWHDFITCWIDLTGLMRSSTEILFPAQLAKDGLVRNRHKVELLKHLRPLLFQWWEKYHPISVPSFSHDLLIIEYQFVRVYINSVTLQAIAARTEAETNSSLRHPFEIDTDDNASIREIVDACTSILQIVLKLNNAGKLKYIPNRVNNRIASSMMYLVKALAVGVQMEGLNTSLDLLDRSLQALQSATVDDMHPTGHYAMLFTHHMKALRGRFVCVSSPITADVSGAPPSFEPLLPFSPRLNGPPNLVNSTHDEADHWMVLPFDPTITDPFEQVITQNVFGLNMGEIAASFWDFLP